MFRRTRFCLDLLHRLRTAAGSTETGYYEPFRHIEAFQSLLTFTGSHFEIGPVLALPLIVSGFRLLGLPLEVLSRANLLENTKAAQGMQDVFEKKLTMPEFMDKTGYHPFKGTGFLFCFQFPLNVTAISALSGMSSHPDMFRDFGLNSSFGWVESLALADPYGVLPILSIAGVYANVWSANKEPVNPQVFKLITGLMLVSLPVMLYLPSAYFVFGLTNLVWSFLAIRAFPVISRILKR